MNLHHIDPSSTYHDATVILAAAGIILPAFSYLRISPVVGFILVGIICGPHGLGQLTAQYPWLDWFTISNISTTNFFGELGINLLMFMIGLELSLDRLRTMRHIAFGLGGAQVILTGLAAAAILVWIPTLHVTTSTALILGVAIAFSSTAIVLPILARENRLFSGTGRATFAILLLQDLALIPILFMTSLGGKISWADMQPLVIQGGLAILALFFVGRWVISRALRAAARTQKPEMFMSAALLVIIGSSALTASAGLSMALGSLIAGLIIADSEYHKQVAVTIEPFQGLLLGVFLISVGMNLDVHLFLGDPLSFLRAAFFLVLIKGALAWILLRLWLGPSYPGATRSAMLLGPGGETGLIIIAAAMAAGAVNTSIGHNIQLVIALSMTAIPLLSSLGQVAERYMPLRAPFPENDFTTARKKHPVIVVGMGRVGSMVVNMLEKNDLSYVAIDSNPDTVTQHLCDKRSIIYGNASSTSLFKHLGMENARALVLTIDQHGLAEHLIPIVHQNWPDLPIICRARDDTHAAFLYSLGAHDVVPETTEASLQLSEAVLSETGLDKNRVHETINVERRRITRLIRNMAHEEDETKETGQEGNAQQTAPPHPQQV